MAANCSVCNKKFNSSDLWLSIKDVLPKQIRDELDDHPEDYRSLTYKDFCGLMYTIEVKDEGKRSAVHIKKIASTRESSLSNSNNSVRIPRRNKAKTGVSNSHNSPIRAPDRHHGAQRYCVLCKKAGMPERKYVSHSTKYFTGLRNKCSIKDGIGGPIGIRTHDLQQHKKYKNKWKKELKSLKKQNKILYSIIKKSGFHREINKIKNIRGRSF